MIREKWQRAPFLSYMTCPTLHRLALFFTYLCWLLSPSKLSHLHLFWNPRPGVCQTSDPHSVGSALWFSSLLPAPCFLCLFSRLVTLVLPLTGGSFIITFEHIISIRKNYELNNYKWNCKEFPGDKGYYNIFECIARIVTQGLTRFCPIWSVF